jgi:large subunit ribosomal protein L10
MITKEEIVKKCNEIYSNNEFVITVDFKGMNATDTSSFRGELKNTCGVDFLVVKNTLNKLGAKGTDYEGNINLKGQCGIIACDSLETMAKVSKVIGKFCFKDNKAKFVNCYNKSVEYTEDKIKELSTLPSIEVLRTKILYLLNSTASSLARVINERVKKESEEKSE